MSNWRMAFFLTFALGVAESFWGLWGYITQANNSPSVESRLVSGLFFAALSFLCFLMSKRRRGERRHMGLLEKLLAKRQEG
jgi:hypothetical protein